MIGTIGTAAKRRTAGSRSDARGTARGMRRTAADSIMASQFTRTARTIAGRAPSAEVPQIREISARSPAQRAQSVAESGEHALAGSPWLRPQSPSKRLKDETRMSREPPMTA